MGHIARLAAVIGCLVFGTSVVAQQVIVIGNDMGGIVGNRAAEIQRINASGARVEIRGDVCVSSCTMYLGVGDVCVSPTDFSFHGPSFFGADLPERDFEYWSQVIASTTTRRCATGSCPRHVIATSGPSRSRARN